MIFETEAEGEDDVADGNLAIKKYPDLTQIRSHQKLSKHPAYDRLIEIISAWLLLGQTAHHSKQRLFVLHACGAKNDAWHSILRFVRLVWRPVRSIQSGDWLRFPLRCRRGRTRGKGSDLSSVDRSGRVRAPRRLDGGRPCRGQKYERAAGRSLRPLPTGLPRCRRVRDTPP